MAVAAVVVHEVVVAAREEEEEEVARVEEVAVLHEVVAAPHEVAVALHEVAAGRGALRARRQCRVHPIPRMDAPAEALVIEPEATGRRRPTCRVRAGPAAALETVPARETSLIGQALVLARAIAPALERPGMSSQACWRWTRRG